MVVRANPDGMTLEDVGHVLGVTRERVRQIEVRAFLKLRDSLGFSEFSVGGIAYELTECESCSLLFLKGGRDGPDLCSVECTTPKVAQVAEPVELVKPLDVQKPIFAPAEFEPVGVVFQFWGFPLLRPIAKDDASQLVICLTL
jgi:hypothetical protein